MNFLNELNSRLGYNDENERVDLDEVSAMVRALENNVNVFGFNPNRLISDFEENYPNDDGGRYAKHRLFLVALHWIYFWGSIPSWDDNADNRIYHKSVDLRNEKTVERCKDICLMPGFEEMIRFYSEIPNYNDDSYNALYSEQNVSTLFFIHLIKKVNQTMHKTNIQTATELMVFALSLSKDKRAEKIVERLKRDRGERFYSLPMI